MGGGAGNGWNEPWSEPQKPEPTPPERVVSYAWPRRDAVASALRQNTDWFPTWTREKLFHDTHEPPRTFGSPEGAPYDVTRQVANASHGIIVLEADSMRRDSQRREIEGLAANATHLTVIAHDSAEIPPCLAGRHIMRFSCDADLAQKLDAETRREVPAPFAAPEEPE